VSDIKVAEPEDSDLPSHSTGRSACDLPSGLPEETADGYAQIHNALKCRRSALSYTDAPSRQYLLHLYSKDLCPGM